MPWIEVSDGLFQRPIGENETFIKIVGEAGASAGREHWAITATASLIFGDVLSTSGSRLAECLREAWKYLRFLLPSIASYVSEDKIVYEVPSSTKLESWVNDTFIVASDTATTGDIIANRKPSSLTTLHYLPTSSELVLQTSHWRTDGIGIFYVLDVYLDIVCRIAANTAEPLTWGTEPSLLSPSIEEAADVSFDQWPEVLSIAEKYVGTFALVTNQIGVKYHGTTDTPPAGTRVQVLQLSESDTTSIVAATKTHNVSVTSALHASVAAANYAFAAEQDQAKPFTSTIRFGLRPYVLSPFKTRTHGAALYTSGYMFQVPSTQTWSHNASAFNAEYRKGYDDILPAHRQYARLLGDAIRNMPPPPPDSPPDSNIDISSVGVVDSMLTPIHGVGDVVVEVERVSVGVELVTRQMVCFVWTFRGKLNLQLNYNEAYHSSVEVEKILRFIRDTTMRELGI